MKSYSELKKLKTYEERIEYLRLKGSVGIETFGFDRYLNQALYSSPEWKKARETVLIRDNGCDLGINGRDIPKHAIIHHMNPITEKQIEERDPEIFNPEYLITVTHKTHNAIHYGNNCELKGIDRNKERKPGDTRLW